MFDMTTLMRVQEHYDEGLQYFSRDQTIVCALQGSQNYGLDTEESDVDTKLLVLPTFKQLCFNEKPVSTTIVRANDEHIDAKDLRLYFDCFKKQNINFLEILFTDYAVMNAPYANEWYRLVQQRETIVRMNPERAISAMYGNLKTKHACLHKVSPARESKIFNYGYDGKEACHIVRFYDFLCRYMNGESYETCLRPQPQTKELCMELKAHELPVEKVDILVEDIMKQAEQRVKEYNFAYKTDPEALALLDDVQYNIMKIYMKREMEKF